MTSEPVIPAQMWVILPLDSDLQKAFFAGDKVASEVKGMFVQTAYYQMAGTNYPAILINSDGTKINTIAERISEELGLDRNLVKISAVKLLSPRPVESGRDAPKVYG